MRRKMQRRAQIAKLRKFLTTDIILSGLSQLPPLKSAGQVSHERPTADVHLTVKRRVAASPDLPFAAGA
jgi:hypothetical protein